MNVKSSVLISLFSVITAFSASSSIASDASLEATKALAIKAFVDICVRTAPSFADAAIAAKSYGIDEIRDLGFMAMGATSDQKVAVQIKKNMECAITTESQTDATLTRQFIQSVAEVTKSEPRAKVPFRASVQSETFIFQHDREGGEAFVMLKQRN